MIKHDRTVTRVLFFQINEVKRSNNRNIFHMIVLLFVRIIKRIIFLIGLNRYCVEEDNMAVIYKVVKIHLNGKNSLISLVHENKILLIIFI